jgi:hypothetical protein
MNPDIHHQRGDRAPREELVDMSTTTAPREYFRDERPVERRTFSVTDARGALDRDYVAIAYSIITTDLVVFEAFETDAGHSCSRTSPEYGRLGAVRSRPLDPAIDSLPYGDERTRAVDAWHDALDVECEAVIRAAYPNVRFDRFSMGQGMATLDEVVASERSGR